MAIEELKAKVGELFQSVYNFHDRFDLLDNYNREKLLDRIAIQREEVDELKVALESESMNNVANEAVDVLYVALGTIISIDKELAISALNEVIVKNNNKTDDTHYLNTQGKVVKHPN
ncbi:MAG: hypothetical protein ACJ0OY_03835 [Dehalococcoidia bacterium]